MKLIIKSFIIVAVLIVAGSNGRAQTTPLAFNDKLSSITDSLYARGKEWGLKFNNAYKTKNFKSLIPARIKLEKFVDANIARVKVMKDVKNSKDLRMAMISFLQFEKTMITKAFKPMELIEATATEVEIKAALDRLTDYSKEESGELAKVAKAQEAYGAANGFQIEPAKTEETPGKG